MMAGEPVVIFRSTFRQAIDAQNIVWKMEDDNHLPRTAFNMAGVGDQTETSANSQVGERRLRAAFELIGAEVEEDNEEKLDGFIGQPFGLNRPKFYPK